MRGFLIAVLYFFCTYLDALSIRLTRGPSVFNKFRLQTNKFSYHCARLLDGPDAASRHLSFELTSKLPKSTTSALAGPQQGS